MWIQTLLQRRVNRGFIYFNVSKNIQCLFYKSFIESLLTFSFICWFNALSVRDKNCLNGIVKVCSKIIGVKQEHLSSLWNKRVVKKAKGMIAQHDHILSTEFSLMPSGRRFKAPSRRTNHYSRSFIPSAIRLLNLDPSLWKWLEGFLACVLGCTMFFMMFHQILWLSCVFIAVYYTLSLMFIRLIVLCIIAVYCCVLHVLMNHCLIVLCIAEYMSVHYVFCCIIRLTTGSAVYFLCVLCGRHKRLTDIN